MTKFAVTVGNSENIHVNPVVYSRGDTPVPAGDVLDITVDQAKGRYVGFYRKQNSKERESATLCEVVVIGREVIGLCCSICFMCISVHVGLIICIRV